MFFFSLIDKVIGLACVRGIPVSCGHPKGSFIWELPSFVATKHKYNTFDFERLYDARSAGGRFPSQIADYAIYGMMEHGVIEVKQVAHDFRLPAKNFPRKKFPALVRRQQCGGAVIILIYHSTTKRWRVAPFEYFNLNADLPSWDVSVYPTYKTVDEALGEIFQRFTFGAF